MLISLFRVTSWFHTVCNILTRFVRCINCSYNNVAKGIRPLIKKHFCLYRKKFLQVRAFERYNSLIILDQMTKLYYFLKWPSSIYALNGVCRERVLGI